ncbi:hypothetical protein HMPREF9166_1357 [Selenomonas sp. oral taxon 149 str. 67H29BP]|nr:hypothetical protein HMPREF9166_1357 [Selenomonas sp. oral taxon 149 str. 67H29BP]
MRFIRIVHEGGEFCKEEYLSGQMLLPSDAQKLFPEKFYLFRDRKDSVVSDAYFRYNRHRMILLEYLHRTAALAAAEQRRYFHEEDFTWQR